jgi:hypothetical protein
VHRPITIAEEAFMRIKRYHRESKHYEQQRDAYSGLPGRVLKSCRGSVLVEAKSEAAHRRWLSIAAKK